MATNTLSSPSNRQSLAFDQMLARVYTINWEVVVYTLILLVALLTRFWDLGVRVMSHDESLHTFYSWELYKTGNFDHTPLMHGPLLFHATAFFYFLFGDNDFSARIYTALLGVAIVMFPLLFRRWLGRWGAIFASIGFLISPMMLYYSRYIRHDIPSIFFVLVMLYCTLEYIDGAKSRRPVYIAVFAGAMSLLLASKEISFFYIAVLGSFLTLFWIFRMIQDAQMFQRVGHAFDSHSADALLINYRQSPLWLLIIGHGLIVVFSAILGYLAGDLIHSFYLAEPGVIPEGISRRVWQVLFAGLIFASLEAVGFVRTFAAAGRPEPGVAAMFANGFKNMRSTLMVVTAGAVLGSLGALWAFSMLYMVDPSGDTAAERIVYQEIVFEEVNGETVEVVRRGINNTELSHFAQWAGFPIFLLVFVVLLIAALKATPWQDVAALLLIALMVGGFLFYFERHSHPDQEMASGEVVAVDPNEEAAADEDADIDLAPIVLSVVFNLAVVGAIVTSRFIFADGWSFVNRQPVFDVLITMGTMIYPWLSAFPLFWAGYQLDQIDAYGSGEIMRMGIITLIPFLMVSSSIGLSWNWRVWPIVVAVFTALFLLFFTTFFTNGAGVGTGVIGSLGYWLEQQEVRRGSQPQYYYIFIQLPVYEFLPVILSGLAGLTGLSWLFEHRRKSRQAEVQARHDYMAAQEAVAFEAAVNDGPVVDDYGEAIVVSSSMNEDDLAYEDALQAASDALDDGDMLLAEASEPPDQAPSPDFYGPRRHFNAFGVPEPPAWAAAYDHGEELARREDPNNVEYLGAVPLLQLMSYWAALILVSLSIAGEKMPWLTTHLTLPLVFIGGWYMGHIVEKVNWKDLKGTGWALLLVVMPVFFIALAQMVLPFATGSALPFQGTSEQLNELSHTSRWLAAFLAVAITGYFIVQMSFEVGWANARRLMYSAGALVLALLTMRAAFFFSFVNYDLPTEFGVYAHAGPAVKDVLDDLQYMADRHPDGNSMHIVYDDSSSWPMLWYLRDFDNKRFICCDADAVENRQADFEGAAMIIVGTDKRTEVSRLMGDDYYMFDLIRLWWPMQDYFFLNYSGINETLQSEAQNPAAGIMRESIWNIWWERDYDLYGEAKCFDDSVERECYVTTDPENPDASLELDNACVDRVRRECSGVSTFNIENWPVSDGLFVFVQKDFAVQIWDAGLNGQSVAERLIPDPEDQVMREVPAVDSFGSGTLNSPTDAKFGPDGLLYVADTGNNRVVAFDPDTYEIVREFGGGNILEQPQGIAFSPVDGNLYIADTWHYRIAVYTLDGDFVGSFGEDSRFSSSVTAFFGPREVEIDRNGNIYVADTGNHRVRVYDPGWNHLRDVTTQGRGLTGEPEPVGLMIHPLSGQLHIAETWNHRVSVFRRDATFVQSFDVNMWAGTRFTGARPYLSVSNDGTLILVSDMDNNESNNGPRVVAYSLSGDAVTAFNAPLALTEDGGPAGVEQVAGIAVAPDDRIFVADAATSRMVVFPPLAVTGGLLPVEDFSYTGGQPGITGDNQPDVDTSSVDPNAATDDASALRQMGSVYWQAQTDGNYDLWRSIHCEEDRLLDPVVRSEEDFVLDKSGYMYPSNLVNLTTNFAIVGDTATLSFSGQMILIRNGEEHVINADGFTPIQLVKRDERWAVCRFAGASTEIFRPGGR